jgi:4-amino-4-deoxy-L-arabinose transferase-like glycosyltransferase
MLKSRTLTHAPTLWNAAIALTLIVYAAGLFIIPMEPDAAVYAEVSMEMYQRWHFLEIFRKGFDWLDKPHFPFWITALSYKAFGLNFFAYKLPAVLFVLLGGAYTYGFGKRFYGRLQGFIAMFILLTSEHIIISNQDVRAEPYMTGLTIMALYHMAVYLQTKKFTQLVWGSIAMGCLVMTKGTFTIIPVAAGVCFALLHEKKWKEILNVQWILCGVLTLLAMAPALYGYYVQFDAHPEKLVFGTTGVSGIRFFLWDSQWGRFRNTGPIKGSGDPFFFVHTMLWAFLPWAFLAFFALYRKTAALVKGRAKGEQYTYFGFISLFLIFSASRFQLSYYLNPLFPLLSIMVADTVMSLSRNRTFLKTFTIIHMAEASLLVVIALALQYFFFRDWPGWLVWLVATPFLAWALYLFTRKGMQMKKILFATAFVSLSVNFYINHWFYPRLMPYQSQNTMAAYMLDKQLPADKLVCFDTEEQVADLMLATVVPQYTLQEGKAELLNGKIAYTTPEGLEKIRALGLNATILKEFEEFHVTMLTGTFINLTTRSQALKKRFLIRIGS